MWSRNPSFVLSTIQRAEGRAEQNAAADGHLPSPALRQRTSRGSAQSQQGSGVFSRFGFRRESTSADVSAREVSLELGALNNSGNASSFKAPRAHSEWSARGSTEEGVGPFASVELRAGDNTIVDDPDEPSRTPGRTRIQAPVAFSTLLFFRTAFIILAFPIGLLYECFASLRARSCRHCNPRSREPSAESSEVPRRRLSVQSGQAPPLKCPCALRAGFRAFAAEWRLMVIYALSVTSLVLYGLDRSKQFPKSRSLYVFSPIVFFFALLIARCLEVAIRAEHKFHIEGPLSGRLRRRVETLSDRFEWLKEVPLPCEPSIRDELGRLSTIVQVLRKKKPTPSAAPSPVPTPKGSLSAENLRKHPRIAEECCGDVADDEADFVGGEGEMLSDEGRPKEEPASPSTSRAADAIAEVDPTPARDSNARATVAESARPNGAAGVVAGPRRKSTDDSDYVLTIEQLDLENNVLPGFRTTEYWIRNAQRTPAEKALFEKRQSRSRLSIDAIVGGAGASGEGERPSRAGSEDALDEPVIVGWDMASIALGIVWHCRIDPPERGHPDFRFVSRAVTVLCGVLFALAPLLYEYSVGTGTGHSVVNRDSYASTFIMTTFVVLAFYLVCEVGWSMDSAIRYYYQRNLQHHLLTSLAVRRGGISLLSTPTLENRHPAPHSMDAGDMAPVMMFRMTDANDLFAWFRIRRVLLAWDMVENGRVTDSSFVLAVVAGTMLTAVGVYVITTLLFGIRTISPGPNVPFLFVSFCIGTIGMAPIALLGAQTNRNQLMHSELLREVRLHLLWRRQLRKQRNAMTMDDDEDETSMAPLGGGGEGGGEGGGGNANEHDGDEDEEIETLLGELAEFVSNEAPATRILGIPINIELATSIGGTLLAAIAGAGASF